MRVVFFLVHLVYSFHCLSAQSLKKSSRSSLELKKELIIDDFIGQQIKPRSKKAGRPINSVPIIETKPGASKVFLIDFDGHWLRDDFWLIVSDNLGKDSLELWPSMFSVEEIVQIVDIIFEDFIMLDVNITTSEAVFLQTPVFSRQRLIVSPTYKWQDFTPGGVARLNSFGRSDSPAFSFLHYSDDPAWVAETCSHELGHTLGLRHDGRRFPREDYYGGSGYFAPIMGNGYFSKVSHWSDGTYSGANNFEDDYAIMTQELHGITIREDDFADKDSGAFSIDDPSKIKIDGMITTPDDVDWFTFTADEGILYLELDLIDQKPNLISELILYDSDQNELNRFNSWEHNHLIIEEEISSGKYYFSIDGIGIGDPFVDGFSDYGSVGRYSITGNVAHAAVLPDSGPALAVGKFYPNPSEGFLKYVSRESGNEVILFQVFNGFGNEVASEEHVLSSGDTVDLDFSHLPKGIYFINVLFNEEVYYDRILISS